MKGPDAFRTISEVAEALDVPQHVLRFWETRFSQVRPMKRGGGRRYYRPEDVTLLKGIRTLLYGEGFTIKGVQRILRERGVQHVMAVATGDVSGDGVPVARVVQFKSASGPPAAPNADTMDDSGGAAVHDGVGTDANPDDFADDALRVVEGAGPVDVSTDPGMPLSTAVDAQVVRSALHELASLKAMLDQAREGDGSS